MTNYDDDLSDVVIPDHPIADIKGDAAAHRAAWLAEYNEIYGDAEREHYKLVAEYTARVVAGDRGIHELKALIGASHSIAAAAEAVGTSADQVCRKLFPSAPPQMVLRIEDQLRQGATSQVAVAHLLGTNQQLVGRIAATIDVPTATPSRGTHPPDLVRRVLKLRSEGESYGQIAQHVGLSRGQAQGIVRRSQS